MDNLSAVIEALILASESPLPLEKICAVLDGVDKMEVKDTLDKLITGYEERQSGISIQEVAGGFQFRTRPELSVWIKKLKGTRPGSLSPAALETLAIIAYRQPIVKAEIESVRGVDVSAPIKGLLEKKLIRIMGRKDAPGKPIIYGTTKKFLEVFNLRELADLPTMRELTEITEQQGMLDLETAEEDGGGQETNPRESFEDQISREISDEISEDDTNS
jgi:segregation and condensation protein B